MRRVLPLVVMLVSCAAPVPTMNDAGASECTTDARRTCAGPCDAIQECSGGAWGSCRPNCPAGTTCDGTACVASCSGTSCDAGATCTGASCDAGATCSGASCDAGAMCSGASCDAGSTCTGASCDAGSPCTGASCDAGVACTAASCPSGCCDGATCRNSALATCGMNGVSCVACDASRADTCVNGACRCGSSAACQSTQSCVNGACVTGCGSGPACTAGQRCASGLCVCDGTSCPNGCCDSATCRAPSVTTCGTTGASCAACDLARADTCANGACRCGSIAACQVGQSCVNGTCVATCGAGPACATGQSCVNGTCVASCGAGPACATGQRCVTGQCVCDATSCPNGCCDGTMCRTPSIAACGTGGASCSACDSSRANVCQSGACRCGSGAACGTSQQCSASGTLATTGVGFDDQQDRLVVPASGWPTSTTSWTFAAWVRLAADRNTFSAFFTLEQPAGHSVEYNELITAADGTTLVLWDHRDQVAVTLGSMTVGTWYFAAVSIGANGAATTWFAPAGGTLTRATGTVAVVDHVEMSYLGASNFAATEFINGSMAMARLWNGVLSDADIAAEFASPTPARTSGLIGDWRLSSPTTVTTDSSGLAHTLVKDPGSTHTSLAGPTFSTGAFSCTP